MSYITLMVTDAGAVAAADTRESFYNLAHFDWLRKVYLSRDGKLVCCLCGPSSRLGIPLFRCAATMLNSGTGTMEERFARIGKLISSATALRLPGEDPGVFVLLAASWEDNGFTVYQFSVKRGVSSLRADRVRPGHPVSLHAGAWHREMPPLPAASLQALDFDALRETARARVELAIEKDTARKQQNRRHNQTIGGQVQTCGIRVKRIVNSV